MRAWLSRGRVYGNPSSLRSPHRHTRALLPEGLKLVSVGDSSVPLMADCLQPEQDVVEPQEPQRYGASRGCLASEPVAQVIEVCAAVVDLGADVLPEVPVLA
jgi:hypothetical protein